MEIKYESTVAYSPKSNGKTEVQNRILMNTIQICSNRPTCLSTFGYKL